MYHSRNVVRKMSRVGLHSNGSSSANHAIYIIVTFVTASPSNRYSAAARVSPRQMTSKRRRKSAIKMLVLTLSSISISRLLAFIINGE